MASRSGMVTFQLHRLNLFWLVVLMVLLSALIFAFGLALGARSSRGEGAPEPAGATAVPAPASAQAPASVQAQAPPPVAARAAPRVALTPPRLPAAPVKPRLPAVPRPAAPRPAPVLTAGARLAATAAGTVPASSSAEAAAGDPPAEPPPAWAVEVGAFLIQEDADALLLELQARGLPAGVQRLKTAAGHFLLSVRLGPFASRELAVKQASELSKGGEFEASIVRSTS